jgi:small-conductance mechanosensitive channel
MMPLAQTTQTSRAAGGATQYFGIHLIGVSAENDRKLLASVVLVAVVAILYWTIKGLGKLMLRHRRSQQAVFWFRQGTSVLLAIILFVGVISIWFDDPGRLATFMGLVSAGVAFALQKPISAVAGYLVILRGKTFTVGDRIAMGGVRGDVVGLRFTQTTIMEMGQPPEVKEDTDPAIWVQARQYTGRIVMVSNSKVFDEPVYNYTRDFPFLWEEMRLPISYRDDRARAERILLDAAKRHTVPVRELSQEEARELARRYFIGPLDMEPRVYWRLTDNWLEMTVRFIARADGVRALKDMMSRQILEDLDAAHISISSSTYDVVGMPPLRVQVEPAGRGSDGSSGVTAGGGGARPAEGATGI